MALLTGEKPAADPGNWENLSYFLIFSVLSVLKFRGWKKDEKLEQLTEHTREDLSSGGEIRV